MKKEARDLARSMFVNSHGKMSNIDIAKAVNVNAQTVSRWKQKEKWEDALAAAEAAQTKEEIPIVRKKAVRDMALTIFIEEGGKISNKDLAQRVGASPATIAKWKEADAWMSQLVETKADPEAPVVFPVEGGPDVALLAQPEQILEINRRIDSFLKRDHLSSEEIADLAVAKSDLLAAVEIYLSIMRETGCMAVSE
jgi:transposase